MIEYKEVMEGEETDQGYEKVIWDDGDIIYKLDGQNHRIDGPAVTTKDGTKAWYIRGKFHREDGPAIIYSYGSKKYYLNDIEVIPSNYHKFSPLQLAKLGLI